MFLKSLKILKQTFSTFTTRVLVNTFSIHNNVAKSFLSCVWNLTQMQVRYFLRRWRDYNLMKWLISSWLFTKLDDFLPHCLDLVLNGLLTRRNFWRIPGLQEIIRSQNEKNFWNRVSQFWEKPIYPPLST